MITLVPKQLNLRWRNRRGRGTLLALVFLGMVLELRTKSTQQKIGKRNKNKTKGRLQVSTENIEQEELYDA